MPQRGASWQWHRRAGTPGRKFHTGDSLDRKAANEFGLDDMHSNVCEWCRDWHDEQFYSRSPEKNPECKNGLTRIHRGGGWNRP